jgi:DNA repair exonuclease SbcCD ATPase subunit
MKKVFFAVAAIIVALSSCTGPSKEEYRLKTDSLYQALAEKDKTQTDLINGMVEISDNLQKIKEKENLVSLNAAEAGDNPDMKDRINEDIKMMYDLMVENQEKIAKLEKQLRSSNQSNSNMKKLIASLNEQLKEKTLEIVSLQEQLKEKNIQIDELNFKLTTTKSSLDSVSTVSKQTSDKLDQTTTELYAGYYVIGSSKELKTKGIVNSEGFLNMKKKVLNKDFDKSYFTEVDTRQINEINTDNKSVKVMTNHPASSYKLIKGSDGNMSIVIKDQKAFWSVSKFCVIQVD